MLVYAPPKYHLYPTNGSALAIAKAVAPPRSEICYACLSQMAEMTTHAGRTSGPDGLCSYCHDMRQYMSDDGWIRYVNRWRNVPGD